MIDHAKAAGDGRFISAYSDYLLGGKVSKIEAGYAAEKIAFGHVLMPSEKSAIFGPYINKK